jgi:hypothetical protein
LDTAVWILLCRYRYVDTVVWIPIC